MRRSPMFYSKSNRQFFILTLFCAALFLLPASASAQTVTGTLQGNVSDAKGAVIPGAEVVIRNMDTGQERTLQTNSDGVYVASFLPLGCFLLLSSDTVVSHVYQQQLDVLMIQRRL